VRWCQKGQDVEKMGKLKKSRRTISEKYLTVAHVLANEEVGEAGMTTRGRGAT
jgi:hypothetical protein